MPLRRRICPVAAKVESVIGTAEALTGTEAAVNVYNWKLARNIQVDQRPGATGFQQLASVHGTRGATATFETDLVGSGTDGVPPFWMSVLAVASGHDLTGDVLACGTTTRTLTIAAYLDGTVEKIVGAVGTYTIQFNSGKASRIAWTFTGKLGDDADVAVLAPTLPTVAPPRWAGGTASVHSLAVQCSTATLDRAAEAVMREDPADATGFIAAHYVDAAPTLTIDPEAVLVATKNWQSILQAHTEGALSIAVGTVAGNTLTFASSTAQVIEDPMDERGKLVTRSLKLQLNGATPFTITQS